MQSPSFPGSILQREHASSLRLSALLVAAFLLQVPALCPTARAAAAESTPVPDSEKKDLIFGKDASKLAKYDVERIGQRGIGHGFNFYSLRREHELGQNLAAMFDRNTKIINDPVITDYVNRIGQKIVRNSDAEVPFTIKVIDSDEVPRAYGLPGGFLYVDSALILAADGEAELAGIMAHEIAHVAARHATRALTRKQFCNIMDSMALIAGPAGLALQDVGGVAGPLSMKKFARNAEYEADLLGLEYAYAAGYDPQALLVALEKLHAMEVKRGGAFSKIPGSHFVSKLPFHTKVARTLASYPLTEERIERLQFEIPAFLPNRKDYVVDTNEFQEAKARLLESRGPVLHRHSGDDDGNKGPVLRRSAESNIRRLPQAEPYPGWVDSFVPATAEPQLK